MEIKTKKHIEVKIEIAGSEVETFTNILEAARIQMDTSTISRGLYQQAAYDKMRVMLTKLFDSLA